MDQATGSTSVSSTTFVFLKTTVRTMQHGLAIALMFALLGNVALGQELDSAALQKEAQAEAQKRAAETAAQPQAAASKNRPQTPSIQATQPQATQPQATQPQVSLPQAVQPSNTAFMLPPGTKLPLGL